MQHSKSRLCLALLTSCFLAGCRTSSSSDSLTASKNDGATEDLFGSNDSFDLVIRAPLTDMFARKNDLAFHEIDWDDASDDDPAWVSQGVSVDMPQKKNVSAQLRVRGGVSRNCDFPPLKMKMKKAEAKDTPFAGHKALKIIGHCGDDKDFLRIPSRTDVLVKIYQIISPASFQSRFANIHYVDGAHSLDITRDGVFLEDVESLNDRLNWQGEVLVPALTAAKIPAPGLSADENDDREDSQRGAMLKTLRQETLDAKRQELSRRRPGLSADAIEDQVRSQQAQILTDAGLPPLLAPISDVTKLLPKLDAALKSRSQAIASSQESFRRQLSDQDMANVLAFEILIFNTDWDVFGLRQWMGPGGGALNVKNVKVLKNTANFFVPIPYDFDLANVFDQYRDYPSDYKNHLKRILDNLNNTSQPTRDHFVAVLRKIIHSKDKFFSLVSTSHLKDDDQKQLQQAITDFVKVSQSLLGP